MLDLHKRMRDKRKDSVVLPVAMGQGLAASASVTMKGLPEKFSGAQALSAKASEAYQDPAARRRRDRGHDRERQIGGRGVAEGARRGGGGATRS